VNVDQARGTDQRILRHSQYKDASNLDARWAIYSYGEPAPTLHETAASLAGDVTAKRVLDVGCGPGGYASAFASATYVGLDLSIGMLEESRTRSGATNLAVADAQRLPISSDAFDVVLAMHMLYHVPDRALAIAELARVVTRDGTALIATNAGDHQAETDAVMGEAFRDVVGRAFDARSVSVNFALEDAVNALTPHFRCEVHPLRRTLSVPTAEPVVAYIASMPDYVGIDDDALWDAFVARVATLVADRIAADGAFRITASSGIVACRRK